MAARCHDASLNLKQGGGHRVKSGGQMEDNQQRRIFRSAVAGVLSVHIFRVTEEGQTVFQRDCFQIRVHIAPYHHQNLISLDPFIL